MGPSTFEILYLSETYYNAEDAHRDICKADLECEKDCMDYKHGYCTKYARSRYYAEEHTEEDEDTDISEDDLSSKFVEIKEYCVYPGDLKDVEKAYYCLREQNYGLATDIIRALLNSMRKRA